jgi:hypothetical protein
MKPTTKIQPLKMNSDTFKQIELVGGYIAREPKKPSIWDRLFRRGK